MMVASHLKAFLLLLQIGGLVACIKDGGDCSDRFSFKDCCSGNDRCTHDTPHTRTCKGACKPVGMTCTPGGPANECCDTLNVYCSRKNKTCTKRNPNVCHIEGSACWDCCSVQKCGGDRKCKCSLLGERCVDDDHCCGTTAVCSPGAGGKSICTDSKQYAVCNGKKVLGQACTSDTDCCENGESVKCVGSVCKKVCSYSDVEYCTSDNECCPGKFCSPDSRCTTTRPTKPTKCIRGENPCGADFQCCPNKCIKGCGQGGKYCEFPNFICTGTNCLQIGERCSSNYAGNHHDACCDSSITTGHARCSKDGPGGTCVACKLDGESCKDTSDCCIGGGTAIPFNFERKCEAKKCVKHYLSPNCEPKGKQLSSGASSFCCSRILTPGDSGAGGRHGKGGTIYKCAASRKGYYCTQDADCETGKCNKDIGYQCE